ncbi:hypothetical protein QEH68_11955 [Paenarthrobacter sp. OM7]|uniref:hypothetical protein n=1 Tax=Paenarthrobacter sp. OM7 TaxID=3041264 RepID=UPI002469BB72|nr:hypothetical protein [Paenarthrobacter sp. OM7]WGM18772.1 hypothetical protein QEH68_11955 [Paenarthrobacter sp. OM7]
MTNKLNSYDGWSPLREVVLGTARNFYSHSRDISFDVFFQDNVSPVHSYYPRVTPKSAAKPATHSIKEQYVDELVEDLEEISGTLQRLGITVHRPLDIDPTLSSVQTPFWEDTVLPALNLRDNTLIIGDEIIETSPMLRSRYFETQFLKNTFSEYFKRGCRWTPMPRPLMTDASFDTTYTDRSVGNTQHIEVSSESPFDVGHEMMIDGAQCLRAGNDIFVNVANANHLLGFEWLKRHLKGRFAVHRIDALTANHIDSMVLALRPGLLLVRHAGVRDLLPEKLQRWDMVIAPEPDPMDFPAYDDDDLVLTSPFIDLNILSLDEETVLVNESATKLIGTLEGAGFTCVPVRHRHRRIFGGGLHCFTLDAVREGGPADYFA